MEKTKKLTPEQEKVIHSKEKTLLVSASAGSGKTKVLVDRILDLIINKNAELKNMLVVTFTNLAAFELKSRLQTELQKHSIDNDFCLKQIDEINVANISTFHKFCQNLIKQYFYEVQIDPDFTILDDSEADYYKNKAFIKMLDFYVNKNDDKFNEIFDIFYENRNENAFKENILKLYNFLKSKNDSFIKDTLLKVCNDNLDENILVNYINNEYKEFYDYYNKSFNDLLLRSNQIGSEQLTNFVSSHLEVLENIKDCNFTNFNEKSKLLIFKQNRLSKPTVEEVEIKEDLASLMAQLKKDIVKFLTYSTTNINNFKDSLIINKSIVLKLKEIVDTFDEFYISEKLKDNKLDFNDLEHFALMILQNNGIREQVQQRLEYIFIDEYQDTNEVQENIVSYLTKDNFIFMVGDVKQSIYGFRQCNPQIFINKRLNLLKDSPNSVIELNSNFRSDKSILDFNNIVFETIMTDKSSHVDYKDTAKFKFGEFFERVESDIKQVNILINKKEKEETEKVEQNKVYSVKNDQLTKNEMKSVEEESLIVAKQIEKLLKTEIYDNDLKCNRKLELKDIAVLTRTKEAIKRVSNTLQRLNIPVNSEFKVDLFDREEIILLISILKIIQNTKDDINLLNVLTCDYFGITDDDLVKVKQSTDAEFFHEKISSYGCDRKDGISQKIKK
ncbi:MAG: UvrD-helicase domain-containing protein, partial [Clostridiales bacterium]|nr:UvrD-helicase domain-containing protein [Candidatus Apopatousia equi]